MKKLVFWLLIFVLVSSTLISSQFLNNAVSAQPPCTITHLTTKLNNGVLSYNQVGNGQPLVLLHGLFASKEQWNNVMCELSQSGYGVIAPDLPGYGESKGFPLKDYALENQVTLLHQWIESLKINSFDMAGNSMGGTIAYLYGQSYPEQLHSLAFIGSPLGIIGWGEGLREAIKQGINPFIPVTKEQFDLEMSLLFFTPPTIPDSLKIDQVQEYIAHNTHYRQVWDIVNLDLNILSEVMIPTPFPILILWGAEDQIYNVRGAEKLQQRLKNTNTKILPKTGHLPHLESLAEVGYQYAAFLQTISSTRFTTKKKTPTLTPNSP
jgi:pimeloyl-ACP methyl ester carboxylesterase